MKSQLKGFAIRAEAAAAVMIILPWMLVRRLDGEPAQAGKHANT